MSLLHSAALLSRGGAPPKSPARWGPLRPADEALGHEAPFLLSQLVRQLHAVLQQQQQQQQQQQRQQQQQQETGSLLALQSIAQVAWVMAATGVSHRLLLQQLLLQVSDKDNGAASSQSLDVYGGVLLLLPFCGCSGSREQIHLPFRCCCCCCCF